MLCDECGKNKATVHLTEIVNEQVSKLNLCESCAKEKGSDVEQHFGIADLLAALSDVEPKNPTTGAPAVSKLKCASCGMVYEDFKKMGRLGCSKCYNSFRTNLTPLLKRIHGSTTHLGKSQNEESMKEQKAHSKVHEELQQAKDLLTKAIKKEEFEEAAALRDKIQFLENKLKEQKAK